MARNPEGFGGAWRVRSGRPGGVGLDDRTAALAGSRRGPCDRKSLNILFYIDKTSYSISCSLPEQALLATAGSEASGTTISGVSPERVP